MPDAQKSPEQIKASEIFSMKQASKSWMSSNFYDQWVKVAAHYKCEREPEVDDETGDLDPNSSSVTSPVTWSIINRKRARVASQMPNLRFRGPDKQVARNIGWKLMRDWDLGGVQRLQQKHVTQALLFGWSVRPWWWEVDQTEMTKRVDPYDLNNLENQQYITDTYGEEIDAEMDPGLMAAADAGDIEARKAYLENRNLTLLERYGRGGPKPLIPVKYNLRRYEGPRTDFLFVGDVFPEPRFNSLADANWLIVQRWRDKTWMTTMAKQYPALEKGINQLMTDKPNGTSPSREYASSDSTELRRSIEGAIDRSDSHDHHGYNPTSNVARWLVTEVHYKGPDSKIVYAAEDDNYIGEIPYPYDLNGKIAFTELVFIEDMFSGVGDSEARIIRGIQELHDRSLNLRFDLIDSINRPYMWTANQELYEDPGLLKRGKGLRLLPLNGPNELGVIGEQAALASAAAGLKDSHEMERLMQMAVGETSMAPTTSAESQQSRTATGARLLAYNQDVLTKAMLDSLNESIRADAEMMYWLNRSELDDEVRFDASDYIRRADPETQAQMGPPQGPPAPGPGGAPPQPQTAGDQYVVSPLDFQNDGEVQPEANSTLADDDQAKVERAEYMFEKALMSPHLINVEKARDELLVAYGKGKDLGEWVPPPPDPNAEPPREPPKTSIAVSMMDIAQVAGPGAVLDVLMAAGVLPEGFQPPGMEPPPDPMTTPPGGTPAAMEPPTSQRPGAGMGPALAAATNRGQQ